MIRANEPSPNDAEHTFPFTIHTSASFRLPPSEEDCQTRIHRHLGLHEAALSTQSESAAHRKPRHEWRFQACSHSRLKRSRRDALPRETGPAPPLRPVREHFAPDHSDRPGTRLSSSGKRRFWPRRLYPDRGLVSAPTEVANIMAPPAAVQEHRTPSGPHLPHPPQTGTHFSIPSRTV